MQLEVIATALALVKVRFATTTFFKTLLVCARNLKKGCQHNYDKRNEDLDGLQLHHPSKRDLKSIIPSKLSSAVNI